MNSYTSHLECAIFILFKYRQNMTCIEEKCMFPILCSNPVSLLIILCNKHNVTNVATLFPRILYGRRSDHKTTLNVHSAGWQEHRMVLNLDQQGALSYTM